ncbi:sensor histidine kinase [Ideonella dechloratans]|uniref:sensor histidine kinase n=1 Tax=Ideonella dechloratans TaxID=36863 RepID=UPI0035B072CC
MRRPGWSLKRTLLAALLPGMLCAVAVELGLTWRTAVEAADAAYDRSLLGAIKSIDASISTASGGLAVELPYRTLEFFELTASGRVHYRVATEDGLVEIGDPGLPMPAHLRPRQPVFVDAVYEDEPVRVGSYLRNLDPPLADPHSAQRVIIQVAEPLTSREAFTRTLVVQAVSRDVVLVLVGGLLLAAAIGWALQPLARLRQEVATRDPLDMTPLADTDMPADVRPLIAALNQHVARTRSVMEERARFIDDASHQLRTPLATLNTLLGFALREPDPARQRDALLALKQQLDDTVRQTNQMLALARADSMTLQPEAVPLQALAERLTRAWWAEARDQGVDLGLADPPEGEPMVVQAQPGLLQEALSNLLHNAIRYCGRGGHVTVQVTRQGGEAWLSVSDDGPGIPPGEMARLGERFFRASNASAPGSGIGLAVVRSVAQRHGGRLQLEAGPQGRGLRATIALPLPAAEIAG